MVRFDKIMVYLISLKVLHGIDNYSKVYNRKNNLPDNEVTRSRDGNGSPRTGRPM